MRAPCARKRWSGSPRSARNCERARVAIPHLTDSRLVRRVVWSATLAFTFASTVSSRSAPRLPQADRTTPLLARLDQAQRQRATLHAQEARSESRIVDRLESVWIHPRASHPGSASSRHLFEAMACEADAVFEGIIEEVATAPTEDGPFLFSDISIRTRCRTRTGV